MKWRNSYMMLTISFYIIMAKLFFKPGTLIIFDFEAVESEAQPK